MIVLENKISYRWASQAQPNLRAKIANKRGWAELVKHNKNCLPVATKRFIFLFFFLLLLKHKMELGGFC